MPLSIETLREQAAYWSDIQLSWSMAVDELWAEHGMDAARVFLFGA